MNWESFSAVDLTASGILALAVLMVLWGKLVPRSVVDDVRTDRDTRLVEARQETADWKAAWTAEAEARVLQAEQIGELLELAKTTDQFIRSLGTKRVDQ